MSERNKQILGLGVVSVVIGFVFLQLWQYGRQYTTNPPVQQEPVWDDAYTRQLAERACFDCHSNETAWPWYARVSPISLMIQKDVVEGRAVLNFSEWEANCCTESQINAMAETVGKREMPLPYYLVLHPEAHLTDVEQGKLINGLISTMEGQETTQPEEQE
jgi:hypothetical protein